MNICKRCGKENQEHYKFCLGCGGELSWAPAAAPAGAAQKTMVAPALDMASLPPVGGPPPGPPPSFGPPPGYGQAPPPPAGYSPPPPPAGYSPPPPPGYSPPPGRTATPPMGMPTGASGGTPPQGVAPVSLPPPVFGGAAAGMQAPSAPDAASFGSSSTMFASGLTYQPPTPPTPPPPPASYAPGYLPSPSDLFGSKPVIPASAPPEAKTMAVSAYSAPPATAPAPAAPPQALGTPGTRVCGTCGAEVPGAFMFCGVCGAKMGAPVAMPQAMPMDMPPPPPVQEEPLPPPMPVPEPHPFGRLTLIRPDGSEGGSADFPEGDSRIGRSLGGLFENDGYLSPTHAEIVVAAQGAVVRDAGSLNGVFLKMTEEEELHPGDVFRIGQELMRFEAIAPPVPYDDGTEVMGSPNPGFWGRLAVIIGKEIDGSAFPLFGDAVTLGRERGDINFPDDGYVSGMHARISVRDGRYFLTDLGSSNGTFIRLRGERVVRDGTFILLGQQLFRVNIGMA